MEKFLDMMRGKCWGVSLRKAIKVWFLDKLLELTNTLLNFPWVFAKSTKRKPVPAVGVANTKGRQAFPAQWKAQKAGPFPGDG